MSWFFKGKAKGIGRYVSNPFKKSPTPELANATAETVQNTVINNINIQNTEVKETLRRRAFNYLKQIYLDYKQVGTDSIKFGKEHPFKALGYGLFTTSMVVFYKTNPDKLDYDDKRKLYMDDMIMCGSTFNKKSQYYLNELNKLENTGLIEYKSFVIFSLMMQKKFSDVDGSYEKQCEQLHSPSKYNIFNLPKGF